MRTSIALAALNRQLPILFILLIGAIGVQTFTSCGKGGGDVKLLESIADDKGNLERKFEYDKQNRLVKIYYYGEGKIFSTKTITYADNLITTEEKGNVENLVINGNKVTLDKETFIINEEGYIAKIESDGSTYLTYQYQNGNLILVTWEESAYTGEYKYDDKKSPFSNCTSPKWLLQHLDLVNVYASKNNVIKSVGESGGSESKYEYDSDGFPTKRTETDGEWASITRFTYRGKGGNAPAKAESSSNKADETAVESKPSLLFETRAKINSNVPELIFEGRGRKDGGDNNIEELLVINSKTQKAVNKIDLVKYTQSESPIIRYSENNMIIDLIDFIDLNFDGYNDMRIFEGQCGNWRICYIYFVWDANTDKFIPDPYGLGELGNPDFDEKTKTVSSMNRSSAADHYDYKHKYINGVLTLIEEISDTNVRLKDDVANEQVVSIIPILSNYPSWHIQRYAVKRRNRNTSSMETVEAKYQFRDEEWKLIAEYGEDSDIGRQLQMMRSVED